MLKEGMFIQDRYEIISKIGSGGMADVYKAKDHTLNRFVAVKVLKPEFRKEGIYHEIPCGGTVCGRTGTSEYCKCL